MGLVETGVDVCTSFYNEARTSAMSPARLGRAFACQESSTNRTHGTRDQGAGANPTASCSYADYPSGMVGDGLERPTVKGGQLAEG